MASTKKTLALLSTSALAAGAAQGAVIYTPVNITVSPHSTLSFDLNQDGAADFQLAFNASGAAKPYITALSGLTSGSVLSDGTTQGLPLTPAGVMIDGSYESPQTQGYFNQDNNGTVQGSWTNPGNNEGYVGLVLYDGTG